MADAIIDEFYEARRYARLRHDIAGEDEERYREEQCLRYARVRIRHDDRETLTRHEYSRGTRRAEADRYWHIQHQKHEEY